VSVIGRTVPSVRRSSVLDAVVAVLLVGAVAFAGWSRLTPLVRRTMWAEDAGLFLQQRVDEGAVVTWFLPYDGYLHLLPRILTDVVVAVTPDDQHGLGTTIVSLGTAGLVAALVYLVTAQTVSSRVARAALALTPVVTPMAALEALGNTANLHWFFLAAVPFVLAWDPAGRIGRTVRSAVLVLIVLSEVQAIVFAPVAAALLWRRRRRELVPFVAYGLAVAAQLVAVATSPRVRGDAPPVDPLNVLLGFVAEPVMGSYASPGRTADLLTSDQGLLVAVLATLPFVVALALALSAPRHPRVVVALASLYGIVVIWTVDLVLNPTVVLDFVGEGMGVTGAMGYARYALVPSMLLLSLGVLAADRLWALRRWWSIGLAALALVGLAVVVARQFEPYTWTRAAGPDWAASWAVAEATCALDTAATVKVASAPVNWGLVITCEDLLGPGLDG